MATLGEILRDARETRDISLPQAERDTKIRQKYISALEDDNLALLPGPTYARGFLRNYASYLGIDPQEALNLFDGQSQPTRDKIKVARGEPVTRRKSVDGAEKINIQPLSPEPIDARVRYGTSYIALSLLALPLLIAFYFVYSAYAGRDQHPPIPTVIPRPATVTPLPSMTVPLGGPSTGAFSTPTLFSASIPPGGISAQQTITSGLAAQPTSTTKPANNVVVKVTTTRDAWMQVLVDGVQQFSGTLPKGTNKQWTGSNTVRIRTGRADSVSVNINGADKGFMGDINNLIVEKEWNRSGAERVIQK